MMAETVDLLAAVAEMFSTVGAPEPESCCCLQEGHVILVETEAGYLNGIGTRA